MSPQEWQADDGHSVYPDDNTDAPVTVERHGCGRGYDVRPGAELKFQEATMGLKPMKPLVGPFGKLLYSRKFLLLCLDVGVAAVLYFVGKYAGNSVFADVKFLIGILQPVVIAIIIAIAVEDAAAKRAGL